MAKTKQPEPEFDLAGLVTEHISRRKSPDPYEVANNVIEEIPDSELLGVVEEILPIYVRERIDAHRRNQQRRKRSRKGKNTESVKWAATGEHDWDDIFWTSVFVPGEGRMWLGNCTKDNIAAIKLDYEEQANDLIDKAECYGEILDLMQSRRAKFAYQLPADLVREAFAPVEEDENEDEDGDEQEAA